jgi:hypothetical protein
MAYTRNQQADWPDWTGALMGKLVVSEFISLDGVIEDPGGAEGEWGWTDFPHSGWTFEFDRGDEGDTVSPMS